MNRRVVSAPAAELRLREAAAWLEARPVGEEVLVIGATHEAASEVIRAVAMRRGTGFGWHRLTLGRLAAELAKQRIADAKLAPGGALVVEALCARIVHRARAAGSLSRLAAVADQPGLPRALARTLHELRMAGAVELPDQQAELGVLLQTLLDELASAGLADRARVFELATDVARDVRAGAAAHVGSHPLCGLPVLLVDVPVRTHVEHALLEVFLAASPDVLATVPTGDDATAARLTAAIAPVEVLHGESTGSLRRVQSLLFAQEIPPAAEPLDDTVTIFSAPGESRECVEIARRILREARRGVPFDRQAVLLRSPQQYRIHLEEAFSRAGIDAYFEQGTVRPDPAGRAFVALLACKAEGLSAKRFAEYLSLGEVPDVDRSGAPPDELPSGERWVPPDEELLPRSLLSDEPDKGLDLDLIAASIASPVAAGSLRAPWRWESLLVDASVIGGRDRWVRRLDGLEAKLRLEQRGDSDDDGDKSETTQRMLVDLEHLRRFALPLLDELEALPASAPWGAWLDRLGALATRALRRPDRVLELFARLAPMRDVGPVELTEIVLVLEEQLEQLEVRPPARRYGRVLVAPIEAARGMAFDVVYVPGLAERMFPQKIIEDPLLLDAMRARLAASDGLELPVRDQRLADERLALRVAVGAARERLVLSYPRIDLEEGRPRVPSFYGLEVLEAAEGELPDFDELGRRADITGAARIGWPAPVERTEAVDEAEHDLALLGGLMSNVAAPIGAAAYLVNANAHLARALRFRARRWTVKSWKPADGLVVESHEGIAALARHAPTARSFSPTALEQLATCPYRFALRAIVKLEPREEPEPIEQLGALERGSLIHEVQFQLLSELRDAAELPVRAGNLDAARDRLDAVLDRVAARFRDDLCPAIDRVWDDGIAAIRADLREWLRRIADDTEWIPERFELAFGPVKRGERDPASTDREVPLDIGLSLRGSIDLVERGPENTLRATDHKSGAARVAPGAIIAKGESLQPVLYALVLEQLFPGSRVSGGRLFYCTTRGNFSEVTVPLDETSRAAARLLADTLKLHFDERFFPAAPTEEKACAWCDYRMLCGSQEWTRSKRKQQDKLVQLGKLRGHR